jgi:hypothetical protein
MDIRACYGCEVATIAGSPAQIRFIDSATPYSNFPCIFISHCKKKKITAANIKMAYLLLTQTKD